MFTVKAPAKINWSLYVLDERDDGYHNILTLMQCIGLYDSLTFEQAASIELVSGMDLPERQNIVFRAAEALRDYAGVRKGARIILVKDIPDGAGLGGGSSDAACALAGLDRLWGLGLGTDELCAIGSRLGSDVPFFFRGPLAIAGGRGEILTPLAVSRSYTVLLVKPPAAVSTGWAYGKLKASRAGGGELTKSVNKINNIQLIYEALEEGNTVAVGSLAHNDFENAVMEEYPVIGILKEAMLERGAVFSTMSGSGSAVFGLFDDRAKALAASGHFSSCFNRVVETLI